MNYIIMYFLYADICKQKGGPGANLASIHSFDKNMYVKNIMDERNAFPTHKNYWVGMKTRSESNNTLDIIVYNRLLK